MSFGKDSYVAKNDSAFTGGTSEEVQVVGKDDQKKLVEALTSELLASLTNKSKENSSPGTSVYLITDSAKVDTVTYSAKVGETAVNLTASLTIKASLLRYKVEDVTTLVNSSIDQAVPTGYIRANLPSSVDLTASSISDDGSTVKGNAKVQVALLPVVDNQALQSSLKGKNGSALGAILTSAVPGYLNAEVVVTPSWIPSRFKIIRQSCGACSSYNSSHMTYRYVKAPPGYTLVTPIGFGQKVRYAFSLVLITLGVATFTTVAYPLISYQLTFAPRFQRSSLVSPLSPVVLATNDLVTSPVKKALAATTPTFVDEVVNTSLDFTDATSWFAGSTATKEAATMQSILSIPKLGIMLERPLISSNLFNTQEQRFLETLVMLLYLVTQSCHNFSILRTI
jgi:hypothetical protein